MRPLLFVALATLLLAGCSGIPSKSDLGERFGAANVSERDIPADLLGGKGGNVTVTHIAGDQIEVHFAADAWATSLNVTLDGGQVDGPAMAGSTVAGGGGDRVTLANPVAGQQIHVRLRDPAAARGLTVAWFVVPVGYAGLPTPLGRAVADATFAINLTGPATFSVGAFLLASATDPIDQPFAILENGVPVSIRAHYAISGEVQPVRPGGSPVGVPAPVPEVTPRDQMVDSYAVELPAGATITAATTFAGGPEDGTDVDLGAYDPNQQGVVCSGSGGSGIGAPIVPDSSQASEHIEAVTESAGSWTLQVGAMAEGCGGIVGYYYNNAGPVPYKLDLTVG